MAFFNEFPHTRTYDSDLAWLIRRMKEVLARMASLEEKMNALEQLVADFIATLNIEQAIKDALNDMIAQGVFNDLLTQLFNDYTANIDALIQEFVQRLDDYYTKTEIDALLLPTADIVYDQGLIWGTDLSWASGRGLANFNVNSAHLLITNFSAKMSRIKLSVSGSGDTATPQSTSYSPEIAFTNSFRDKIRNIFKSSEGYVISKNASGFWNNSFTFNENNELYGVVLAKLEQGWTPKYTSNSSSIWTDATVYNLAR